MLQPPSVRVCSTSLCRKAGVSKRINCCQAKRRSAEPCQQQLSPPGVLAIDVEYTHYRLETGTQLSAAAQVCVVNRHRKPLYSSYIHFPAPPGSTCIGGIRPQLFHSAPSLEQVLSDLSALTTDQLLVGHGLTKDLKALGLKPPRDLVFDTMAVEAFQTQKGHARNLRSLAKEFLNRDIHGPGQQHDAVMDAQVVMLLYLKVAQKQRLQTYEDMVQFYLEEMLQGRPKKIN